ncbi:MAG: SMP-30/gluconolactonase/LRE family protein [Chloroflexi bacterium]|nr:MAG: SMP-30/gluconolactonase/LRE family protein [Chloroflexota bacterium]
MNEVELLVDAKAIIGEGPIWDDQLQKLLWVDIMGKTIYVYDPVDSSNVRYDVGQFVGTIVPWRSNEVMLAVQDGFASYNFDTKQLNLITNPEADKPQNRFNDGKCDPAGRFWAGTMALENPTNEGALYCMGTDFSVQKKFGGVGISNGIVWSLDHKIMYYIDSIARNVRAYDYDLATGDIGNERVIIEVPEEIGVPDGMAIDEEGMLWIAKFHGSRVSRWHPQTGEVLQTIYLPASCITACAFGDKNLDTLYITSAALASGIPGEPLAGGLFAIKPGVRGVSAFRFGG